MRAMILRSPGPVETAPLVACDVPDPRPAAGQVLVKVNVCGVCHTDLHTVEGDLALPRLPIIPGHQVVGTVLACGPGTTGRRVGQRVGAAWLNSTCGQCQFCRSDQENLCPEARFTGLHADGGYAEYLALPADFTYDIPDPFPDDQAAPLLCAGIIGYRALRRSGIREGQTLAMYGFGASAHVAIQVARHWGCQVYVFTRSREHRDLALRLGAAWVGSVPEQPPRKVAAAVIFAPAGDLVPHALECLDRGGCVALAGIHMSPTPPLDYQRHLYCEKTITSVTAATRLDGQQLLALAAEIPIRTHVTTFHLAEANRVLQMVKHSRLSGAAVLDLH